LQQPQQPALCREGSAAVHFQLNVEPLNCAAAAAGVFAVSAAEGGAAVHPTSNFDKSNAALRVLCFAAAAGRVDAIQELKAAQPFFLMAGPTVIQL